MLRFAFLALVLAVGGSVGCASGGRASSDPQKPGARGTVIPTTEQVESAAPGLAKAVSDWRTRQRAGERLVVRGPTFVGLEGVPAEEARGLGAAFSEALNRHADARVRFVSPGSTGEEVGATDTALDARATWEPAPKRGPDKRPRLVLEVIDPASGKTVYSADSGVAPSGALSLARGPASRPAAGASPALPKTAEPSEVPQPASDSKAVVETPARVQPAVADKTPDRETPATPKPALAARPTGGDKSWQPPQASAGPSGSARASGTRDRDATRVSRSARPAPPGAVPPTARGDQRRRSPVLPLAHGVVYFADAGLAERVIVLQERAVTLGNGDLSVRLLMSSRKGKKTLEIRCDFYDERGTSAGSVESVELPIHEGVPATISLASRRPAVRYVLFAKD